MPDPLRDDVVLPIRTAELFNAELFDVIDRLIPVKKEKYRRKFAWLT